MSICPQFGCKEHTAPVLPCWYCEGKDGDGQAYDPRVHHQWGCEACDERRAFIDQLNGVLGAVGFKAKVTAVEWVREHGLPNTRSDQPEVES